MGKKRRTHAIKPMAYQLPEDHYRGLKQVRDHLLFMAELSAPLTRPEAEEFLPVPRFALAHCFERLAGEVDGVIQAAWWPGEGGALEGREKEGR